MKSIAVFLSVLVLSATALAKLPPPGAEAQAKAAEAKAKKAHAAKVEAYALCKAQDRAASNYRKTVRKPMAAMATPPCAKP